MSDGHAIVETAKHEVTKGILNFAKKGLAEVAAEIVGMWGYHTLQDKIKKWSGVPTTEHHDAHDASHKPEGSGTITVDPEGHGFGDEQTVLEELAAVYKAHSWITNAQYTELTTWFNKKSKTFRENFRNGYLRQTSQAKRLRVWKTLAQLTEAERENLFKTAGYEEEHHHSIKDDLNKLAKKELVGINHWLGRHAKTANKSPLVKISKFEYSWLRPFRFLRMR